MRRPRGDVPARLPAAPASTRFAVCPHCWGVNPDADRLCARCGADMHTLLQESGGLRATAPVQSPVPVRVRGRLSPLQRALVLAFVVTLFAAQVLAAVFADRRAGVRLPGTTPAAAP
jgi:predicted amidophosphoribosyltransferase